MKHTLSWQHVAIVGMLLASIVALAATGQDLSAIIGLGTLLLAGIGLTTGLQLAQRDATNGHQTELLALVRDLAEKVAVMSPPPAEDSVSNGAKRTVTEP